MTAHGEGSWIALRAAARENDIAALALLAAPGTPGAELVLEQQRIRLEEFETPQAEREQQVALQERIVAAVLGEGEWDGVPQHMRQRADTPWFRSFLEFDPAEVVRRTRQPVLLVHGKLDRQIPIEHVDRLEQLMEARRRREATLEVARLPGVDHRLLDAAAGAIDRYNQLLERRISSAVTAALARLDGPERPGAALAPPGACRATPRHVGPALDDGCIARDHAAAAAGAPRRRSAAGRPPASPSTRRCCRGSTATSPPRRTSWSSRTSTAPTARS